MTGETGIENLENHESEENSRVGPSHDLDGKFLRGHPPLKGAGRPPGSRKAARDVMNGAMRVDAFERIVNEKLKAMAMGSGKRSLSAGIWYLQMANYITNHNHGKRRRKG